MSYLYFYRISNFPVRGAAPVKSISEVASWVKHQKMTKNFAYLSPSANLASIFDPLTL